jgi:hypothetical protein
VVGAPNVNAPLSIKERERKIYDSNTLFLDGARKMKTPESSRHIV